MIDAPSSTWFTASPHWHWLIVIHFVLGALAGGSFFLAALIDIVGRPKDRRLARLGYYITLPLLLVIGVVLIVDLSRPDRFWHLLVEIHTLRPMFKPWSPMSTGSWAILGFGFFALLAFLASFAEHRRPHWRALHRLRPPGILGTLVVGIGALFALWIMGYTGVMLSVLNRPIWSDTSLMGMLFVVSAVAMGAALVALAAHWLRWTTPGTAALHRIWASLVVAEFIVLIALVVSLGPAARGWINLWGVLLIVGVVVLGIGIPLLLYTRPRWLGDHRLPAAAALVVAGGFILRTVIVFTPDTIAP